MKCKFFIFGMVTFLFISCAKETEDSINIVNDHTGYFKVGQTFFQGMQNLDMRRNESADINYATMELTTEKEFQKIEKSINKIIDTKLDGNLIFVSFYLSELDANKIDIKAIKAISIFYSKNNLLYHKLYQKKDVNFEENTFLSKVTLPAVELNLIQDISICYNYKNWFLIKTGYASNLKYTEEDGLRLILAKIINRSAELYTARKKANSLGCNSGVSTCNGPSDCLCSMVPEPGGGMDCGVFGCNDGPICPERMINSKLDNTKKFNSNKTYSFRDDFLKNYDKGNLYISYYYSLGEELNRINYFTISNVLSDLSFYKKIYKIADILQNGNSNEVVITQSDKYFILNKINYFKNLSPNNLEFQSILNQIKIDINHYGGLSRLDIINDLE